MITNGVVCFSILIYTESLLKDNSLPSFDSVRKIDDANKQTMVLIISHFQNLFDVDEVGV